MQGYKVIQTHDRVYAIDGEGVEICGAWKPVGHNYWQMYVTKLVANVTGLRTPPHREHFWGNDGRQDARAWVETIASLYALAVSSQGAAA